jgi:hypothetical protein
MSEQLFCFVFESWVVRSDADHVFIPPADSKFNDLVQFDTATMTWTDLSRSIQGASPAPRDGHGFAALDGKVYIFAGNGSTSSSGASTGIPTPTLKKQ